MKKLTCLPFLILTLIVILPTLTYAEDESQYELAVRALADGKENDSFIHVKNALQKNPNHIPSRLLLSELYFNAANIPAAEEELINALDLGADINLVIPLLGTSLILQKKIDKLLAYKKYSSQFSFQTKFEWALLMGQAYLLRGHPEAAERNFQRASQMFPNEVRALNTLAAVYLRIGKAEEAQTLINKSISLEPNNAKTWQLNGELELKKGKSGIALEHFNKAYSLDNKDPKILRNLAGTYLQSGNLKQVRKFLAIIKEQTPDDPTATLITAWLMLIDNDLDAANNLLSALSDRLSLVDSKQ